MAFWRPVRLGLDLADQGEQGWLLRVRACMGKDHPACWLSNVIHAGQRTFRADSQSSTQPQNSAFISTNCQMHAQHPQSHPWRWSLITSRLRLTRSVFQQSSLTMGTSSFIPKHGTQLLSKPLHMKSSTVIFHDSIIQLETC